MRMRIVLAVTATVAALVTAWPVTAAAGGYVPHRCYVSNLAARFHGAQAGLGNRGFLLTLTNVSGASCRLDGHPGLELRGVAARPLPTRERRGRPTSPRTRGRG